MINFRRLSIKYKLIIVVVLSASAGLLISSTALVVYDQMQQRKAMAHEARILASVVGQRSAAALSFLDHRNAQANLLALEARPNLQRVCLYNQLGMLFEQVLGDLNDQAPCPLAFALEPAYSHFSPEALEVLEPVYRGEEIIGALVIRIGLDELRERIQAHLLVTLVILMVALGLGFLLTSRLQRQIYTPILQLGEIARQITQAQNYDIRAERSSEDEIGDTVQAFNDMLNEIALDKKRLFEIAYYDHLTGLPNRRLFSERLEDLLRLTSNFPDRHLALMFLDLDKFKQVNDTLGHDVGDLLLVEFAKRIGQTIPEKAQAFRLGGDEFTVIQRDLANPLDARVTAERLLKAFQAPLMAGTHQLEIASSIGIAISDGTDSMTTLMKRADIALYRVKESGRGHYHIHDDTLFSQGGSARI